MNKNNKIKLKIIDINNDETQIEIDNKDYVKTIIKLYCESKEESESNELYLAKKDLNKLDENLTVNEAKINNNETLYIFEEDKIEFIINYNDKDFKINGNSKMTFDESIKSFIEENGNKNFVFNLNGEAIDTKEELNKLGIKNGDVIKADQE